MMKKQRIFTVILVALVALLLSSVPVLAQAEKTDFTGTWCRYNDDKGITTALPSGRLVRKDGWAFFDVVSTDPRVAGVFHSTDVTFNLSAKVPGIGREGLVHANFILTPYDTEINGTWEGWWKARYTIEDGLRYLTVTANGHGTEDLDGLKIRVYVKHEMYDLDCDDIEEEDYPDPLFNGYILTPASAD